MMSIDAFYTPHWLAEELVSHISISDAPKVIADFAVGDGALLKAAKQKWNKVKFIANDISTLQYEELKNAYPEWAIGNFDFLNDKDGFLSFASQYICIECGIDIILLNPPFSCRGSRRVLLNYNGKNISCSVALSFVINSLSLLSSAGECICILPNSCLYSEKDSNALDLIKKDFDLWCLNKVCPKTFENCSANTVVVKIKKKVVSNDDLSKNSASHNIANALSKKVNATIFRGKIKVDKSLLKSEFVDAEQQIPFIHTTDIKGDIIIKNYIKKDEKLKALSSFAVLIPRVGKPLIDKIVLKKDRNEVYISDCIIAINFPDLKNSTLAHERIVRNWPALKNIYSGTCAQYITVGKVKSFLAEIGIYADVERC